jgi:hypothetical protein
LVEAYGTAIAMAFFFWLDVGFLDQIVERM